MSEPTQTCQLCGRVEVVRPDGRGFPPDIAKRRLKAKCKAAGCPCSPQYLAGIGAGLLRRLAATRPEGQEPSMSERATSGIAAPVDELLDRRLRIPKGPPTDWVPRLCPHITPTSPHPEIHDGWPCPYLRIALLLSGQPDPYDDIAEWRVELTAMLDGKGRVPLSLNDRHHWAAHASRVAMIKAVTRNAVIALDVPHLDHVHVELHYQPPSNRYRDVDNIVATLKPVIDGLRQRDTATNHPVSYDPIVDDDDPRYLSWGPPILHPWIKGETGRLWMILRSYL